MSPLETPGTVHVFTGEPKGTVQRQLRRSFRARGARVRVHQARPHLPQRRSQLPDLRSGDLVVLDVRFVTHAFTHALRHLAANAGAGFVALRGSTGLAKLTESVLGGEL